MPKGRKRRRSRKGGGSNSVSHFSMTIPFTSYIDEGTTIELKFSNFFDPKQIDLFKGVPWRLKTLRMTCASKGLIHCLLIRQSSKFFLILVDLPMWKVFSISAIL